MAKSHYQVLGVAPHATHDEIRRAFRVLAQQHHPDANPDAAATNGRSMAEINAAWEILGDPEKRQAYDWAIGTTPRPTYGSNGFGPLTPDGDKDDDDPLAHLRDDPRHLAHARPSDLLLIVPVAMFVIAVVTFVFAAMSESTLLRTTAILMAPVTVGAFVAAPLFVMLRSRGRDRDR